MQQRQSAAVYSRYSDLHAKPVTISRGHAIYCLCSTRLYQSMNARSMHLNCTAWRAVIHCKTLLPTVVLTAFSTWLQSLIIATGPDTKVYTNSLTVRATITFAEVYQALIRLGSLDLLFFAVRVGGRQRGQAGNLILAWAPTYRITCIRLLCPALCFTPVGSYI